MAASPSAAANQPLHPRRHLPPRPRPAQPPPPPLLAHKRRRCPSQSRRPRPRATRRARPSNPINDGVRAVGRLDEGARLGRAAGQAAAGRHQPELQGLGADLVHRRDRGDGLQPGRRRLAGAVRLRARARQERRAGACWPRCARAARRTARRSSCAPIRASPPSSSCAARSSRSSIRPRPPGFLFPNALLAGKGIDYKTFFSDTIFAGGHDKVDHRRLQQAGRWRRDVRQQHRHAARRPMRARWSPAPCRTS